MSPPDIVAMLRRHVIAVAIVALVAAGFSYHLVHKDPGYVDSGSIAFTAPKSSVTLFQNTRSLLVLEEATAWYMMGPQGKQQVRAAGGTVDYDVALLNLYNEEFPNYSQPYVTVSATSSNPAATQQTFNAVVSVLYKSAVMLQAQVGATPRNEIRALMVAEPTGPIAQGGSHKRSLAGLAILSLLAIYLTASFLDRRRLRRSGSQNKRGTAQWRASAPRTDAG